MPHVATIIHVHTHFDIPSCHFTQIIRSRLEADHIPRPRLGHMCLYNHNMSLDLLDELRSDAVLSMDSSIPASHVSLHFLPLPLCPPPSFFRRASA